MNQMLAVQALLALFPPSFLLLYLLPEVVNNVSYVKMNI